MQAQRGRAGVSRNLFRNHVPNKFLKIPLIEIFPKSIEYYLQKLKTKSFITPPHKMKSEGTIVHSLKISTQRKELRIGFTLAK